MLRSEPPHTHPPTKAKNAMTRSKLRLFQAGTLLGGDVLIGAAVAGHPALAQRTASPARKVVKLKGPFSSNAVTTSVSVPWSASLGPSSTQRTQHA